MKISGWLAVLLLVVISACAPLERTGKKSPAWSGVWVQARSITTPQMIDDVLQRAAAGGFQAVFVNVFYDGQALFDSALVEKYDKVDPAFDPLAYLVPQAHERGLQVHAWFVVARIDEPESPIFQAHPDWTLVRPDGESIAWLNLTHPQVQRFIGDLMMETVERYEVDGIHFDYTRFPGSEWGFDPHTIEAFTEQYGVELDQMRYAELPAYGLFEGNPLTNPGSGQVLASFSNGIPAVVLNHYGEGQSILLNWKANLRTVAVSSEIMRRSLQGSSGQVHVLRSELNGSEYGYDSFDETVKWLAYLGLQPVETSEAQIEQLDIASVLVLPNVYLISAETAVQLADFVEHGGTLIFIDGPTRSIHLGEIRAITGMNSRGIYYKASMLMTSSGPHALIPAGDYGADVESYRDWDAQWREFRKQGINTLIREVYERVKAKQPAVTVSMTVTADQQEANERYLQDWQAWLQDGYVDLLIPRGYVDEPGELEPVLDAWQPIIQTYDRKITLGLITYTEAGESVISKPPEQLLTEIEMTLAAGSNGLMIFDLGRMSAEQLSAHKGLFPALPAR